MKYQKYDWVIFNGKPHQITWVYENTQMYELFSHLYPEADMITATENEIKPITHIPSFHIGEMVICDDKILLVENVENDCYLVNGYYQTPFAITPVNY